MNWPACLRCRAPSRTRSTHWSRNPAFLLKGDVFTEELLRTYIDYKRENEVDAVRLRPHPYEFALYYDI